MTPAEISANDLASFLEGSPGYEHQIVARTVIQPREGRVGTTACAISEELANCLDRAGVRALYSHQAAAFDLAADGHDIAVLTGTGSGKTLAYNLPVLDRLLSEPAGRALYLFPTKALAQDQLGKLNAFAPGGVRAATYDGDTPKSHRSAIRKSAHIVLTNADMLHLGILPNHGSWGKFFRSLRFIVLDEMHAYSGIFGSHVALILRRLLRLCEFYNAHPQIIASSATIRNPEELFTQLTGRVPVVVSEDGAPSGRRELIVWNPPPLDSASRRSTLVETSRLLSALCAAGVKTLAFSQSRVAAELTLSYARRAAAEVDGMLPKRLEAYRAGLSPQERRRIEQSLFHGDLIGLSATNAMELGVDIGDLDVVIMNGYPGTISSFRQQAGRAGRGERDGVAILVARDEPLDQYIAEHVETIASGRAEAVSINPVNPYVLAPQLKCAAHERPIHPTEAAQFPSGSLEMLERLDMDGDLSFRAGMWFYPAAGSPAADVDIRGCDRSFVIERGDEAIGTMEEWRAIQSAHPGAIYLHGGEQFIVRNLDLERGAIQVEPSKLEYYTEPVIETTVFPTGLLDSKRIGDGAISLIALKVTSVVVAYRTRSVFTGEILREEPLNMPPRTIDTVGLRIDLPVHDPDRENTWPDGVHAVEHALSALAPLIASCDGRDLDSTFFIGWYETGLPAVFVYDSCPGGVGISETLFRLSDDWFVIASDLLLRCKCEDGCPRCTMSSRCAFRNERLSRQVGIEVFGRLRYP